MTRLKDLVKAAHNGQDLIVTGPHSEWMDLPEEEQFYSDKAVEHVRNALQRKFKIARAGRFSPSSIGKCPRRLLYSHAGAPQAPFEAGTTEIIDHGTWTHLKWQAEGLTMGYMSDAEVWVEDGDLQLGGSMDATLHEGSPFELKSAAPSVFNREVLADGEVREEYLDQLTTYMMLFGADWASLVYEDRAYGNFHEFRIPMDSSRERKVLRTLIDLISMMEADELPEPYDDCVMRRGKIFKGCPYRKVCHKLNTYSEAREASDTPIEGVHTFNSVQEHFVGPTS